MSITAIPGGNAAFAAAVPQRGTASSTQADFAATAAPSGDTGAATPPAADAPQGFAQIDADGQSTLIAVQETANGESDTADVADTDTDTDAATTEETATGSDSTEATADGTAATSTTTAATDSSDDASASSGDGSAATGADGASAGGSNSKQVVSTTYVYNADGSVTTKVTYSDGTTEETTSAATGSPSGSQTQTDSQNAQAAGYDGRAAMRLQAAASYGHASASMPGSTVGVAA